MFSNFLSTGPWEMVAPRISTPWNIASVYSDRGKVQGIVTGVDAEYGSHELIYAGQTEFDPQRAGTAVIAALSLIRNDRLERYEDSREWFDDFEYSHNQLAHALNDQSFLTAVSVFFDDKNRQYVEQTLQNNLYSLMVEGDLTSANLVLMGRERNNTLRVAYTAYDQRVPAQVSAIISGESGYGYNKRRAYDGGEVFIDQPNYNQVALSAMPQSLQIPSPGLSFLVKGQYASVNESLQAYIATFGESWGTGQFEIDDSDEQHIYNRYSVLHHILGAGRRVINGSEQYKLRDFLMGEINQKGNNAHQFKVVAGEPNQGHIDTVIPGLIAITSTPKVYSDPSQYFSTGEVRDKA